MNLSEIHSSYNLDFMNIFSLYHTKVFFVKEILGWNKSGRHAKILE